MFPRRTELDFYFFMDLVHLCFEHIPLQIQCRWIREQVNQFGFNWVLFTLIYSPACWPLQEKTMTDPVESYSMHQSIHLLQQDDPSRAKRLYVGRADQCPRAKAAPGGDEAAAAATGSDKSSSPSPLKRLRLRGDWSDTGPNARPERAITATQGGEGGNDEGGGDDAAAAAGESSGASAAAAGAGVEEEGGEQDSSHGKSIIFVIPVQGRDSPIVKHCSSIKNSCFVTCVNSALCSES
jgi:hypothetical protein